MLFRNGLLVDEPFRAFSLLLTDTRHGSVTSDDDCCLPDDPSSLNTASEREKHHEYR